MGGAFEIHLDDQLVYSKKAMGRFPEDGEVTAALEEHLQTVSA